MRLNEEEMETLWRVVMVHKRLCRDQRDWTIEQTSGGIGTNTYAVCGCGARLNITDYDAW